MNVVATHIFLWWFIGWINNSKNWKTSIIFLIHLFFVLYSWSNKIYLRNWDKLKFKTKKLLLINNNSRKCWILDYIRMNWSFLIHIQINFVNKINRCSRYFFRILLRSASTFSSNLPLRIVMFGITNVFNFASSAFAVLVKSVLVFQQISFWLRQKPVAKWILPITFLALKSSVFSAK